MIAPFFAEYLLCLLANRLQRQNRQHRKAKYSCIMLRSIISHINAHRNLTSLQFYYLLGFYVRPIPCHKNQFSSSTGHPGCSQGWGVTPWQNGDLGHFAKFTIWTILDFLMRQKVLQGDGDDVFMMQGDGDDVFSACLSCILGKDNTKLQSSGTAQRINYIIY